MKTAKSDTLFLNSIIKLNNFLSVAPKYDFAKKRVIKSTFCLLYSLTTAAIFITSYVCSAVMSEPYDSKTSLTSKFLDIISSVLLLTAALITTTNPIFQAKGWQKMLRDLYHVNEKLLQNNEFKAKRIGTVYKLLALYCVVITKDAFRMAIWFCIDATTPTSSKFFICSCLYEFYCFSSTILIVQLNYVLNKRYKILVDVLKRTDFNTNYKYNVSSHSGICTVAFKSTYSHARYVTRIYKTLYCIVKEYNSIFGYQVLLSLGFTLISVLKTFDIYLRYKKLQEMYGEDATRILLTHLCTTGFNMVT